MKKCKVCQAIKPLDSFGRSLQHADKHLNICLDCAKIRRRERELINRKNPDWLQHSREMRRLRYYKNKDNELDQRYKYIDKYPERIRAGYIARYKLEDKPGLEMHHWSYNIEHHLDVIYITKLNHRFAHKFIIYDPERMMYRGLDSVLLDTKEEHEAYINKVLQEHGY